MFETITSEDQRENTGQGFGILRPKLFPRTLFAGIVAIVLGVWLAFAVQLVIVGFDRMNGRYGSHLILDIARQEATPAGSAAMSKSLDIGAEVEKWLPVVTFLIAPFAFFSYACSETTSVRQAFVRFRIAFFLMIASYMLLGVFWQDQYSNSMNYPLDLDSDGRWRTFWIFVVLFLSTYWESHWRRLFRRPVPSDTMLPSPVNIAEQSANARTEAGSEGPSAVGPSVVNEKSEERGVATIAYLTFVPALVILAIPIGRKSPFVRFHALQSVLLCVCWLLSFLLLILLSNGGASGQMSESLGVLLRFALMGAWCVAIVSAMCGRILRLPLIGRIAWGRSGA